MPSHRTRRPRAGSQPRRASARSLPVVDETSAGGLVIDVQDGRAVTAVIARRNRGGRLEWCLPKGHLEGTETPEQAAVREIAEETGIHGRVLRHLATIDYWFGGDDHRVHKVVHHFLLEATGGTLTT
ncbi:MAG: NUDIX hydrolase, partial [Actinomyces urogenitalis DORA_12]